MPVGLKDTIMQDCMPDLWPPVIAQAGTLHEALLPGQVKLDLLASLCNTGAGSSRYLPSDHGLHHQGDARL